MPDDPLVSLSVAVHEIGDADHPLHVQTLRRWARRVGALEQDGRYRHAIRTSLIVRLRSHYRAHGRLSPPGVRSVGELLGEAAE